MDGHAPVPRSGWHSPDPVDDHPLLQSTAPFTARQAREQGLTRDVLRRALATGRARAVLRGVYVSGSVPVDLRTRAVGLALVAPHAVVSHESAAALWGVPLDGQQTLHVTVPTGTSKPQIRGVRAHEARLGEGDVQTCQGLRATSPGRTAADLVRARSLVEAVVVADAITHTWPRVVADLAEQAARCRPRDRGAAVLRETVRHVEMLTESPMESRLRMALVLGGLPRPVAQHRVYAGGQFVARLDLAYPDRRLGIEYDGRDAHPLGLARDRRRARALAAAGWVLLPFTAEDVLSGADRAVTETAQMYARRARTG